LRCNSILNDYYSLTLPLQNEISEVFDKLHVSEHDSAIEVIDAIDSSSSCNSGSGNESPEQQIPPPVCEKPERASPASNDSIADLDDWNSLAQFENFIRLEVENLETAAKSNQRTTNATTTVSTTAVKSNILKPEKHVSDNAGLLFLISHVFIIQLNYAECSFFLHYAVVFFLGCTLSLLRNLISAD
jgi:hypothetical protein